MTVELKMVTTAEGLTKAQRKVILATEPCTMRHVNEIHLQTWRALYRKGIVSYIYAGGYALFDLTPFGLAAREHLKGQP